MIFSDYAFQIHVTNPQLQAELNSTKTFNYWLQLQTDRPQTVTYTLAPESRWNLTIRKLSPTAADHPQLFVSGLKVKIGYLWLNIFQKFFHSSFEKLTVWISFGELLLLPSNCWTTFCATVWFCCDVDCCINAKTKHIWRYLLHERG